MIKSNILFDYVKIRFIKYMSKLRFRYLILLTIAFLLKKCFKNTIDIVKICIKIVVKKIIMNKNQEKFLAS